MEQVLKKSDLDSILVNYIPRKLLTQREAVQYTGTSPGTINNWVKKGLRIVVFDENSRPKYDIKDLDEWIDKHKIGGER